MDKTQLLPAFQVVVSRHKFRNWALAFRSVFSPRGRGDDQARVELVCFQTQRNCKIKLASNLNPEAGIRCWENLRRRADFSFTSARKFE
ncbi:hypothetical protein quinque_005761 [Culex quinquefasciatus]